MPYEVSPRRTIAISKVFQKGKVQMPQELREALRVKDKDKVVWYYEDGKYCVEKA